MVSEIRPRLNVDPFEVTLEATYQKYQIESSLNVIAAFLLVSGLAFGSMLGMQLLQPEASAHHNSYTTFLRGGISAVLIYNGLTMFLIPESTDKTGKRMFRTFLALAFVYPLLLLFRPLNAPSTSELALASILYCSSCSFRLNYQKYKVFFIVAVLGYFISYFLFRGALAPNGPVTEVLDVAVRLPGDYVPLLQLLQAALLSYLIYRFSDARERRLFLSENKIASSNSARLHLLQSVGHDLRQPMTSILLQQGIAIEAAKQNNQHLLFESLAVIESSLQIMNAELNQLTEIAALQSENFELQISSVALKPLIIGTLALFRAQSQRSSIEIRFEVSADLSKVCGASNHAILTSILINLISNAIKYSKTASDFCSPVVVVSVKQVSTSRIRISVADNGVGISGDSLTKIWTPFFQVGNPERSRSKGYGLGLTHVQVAITRLASHEVSCESQLGKGSTFAVELPVMSPPVVEDHDLSKPTPTFSASSSAERLVLIVDDEPTVRTSIVTSLHQVGYATVVFASACEACAFVRSTQKQISVALIDYRLPDGTGGDIFKLLIERLGDDSSSGTQLICLTGESMVEENFLKGFPSVKFVRKPISQQALFEIMGQE